MKTYEVDPLFREAEQRATEFSLFPRSEDVEIRHGLEGVLSIAESERRVTELQALDEDEYIRRTVTPSEDPTRRSAATILGATRWDVDEEWLDGPVYAAVLDVPIDGRTRKVGFLAQERRTNNGAWGPAQHLRAVELARKLASRQLPIVTLMDTPGADGDEPANRGNQAHSISRLIAEMAQIHVPTVGIVLGKGYSGGAIPLATTNVLLAVRDGVFNTIQPQGLASIARKYDLSWEQCAQAVGVSAFELHLQGHVDGVIDFAPGDGPETMENFERAIVSSIQRIESLATEFVRDDPAAFEHYQRSTRRFVQPSSALAAVESVSELTRVDSPTEHINVFGVAYRHLRYLGLRRRLTSTTVERYGRLASQEIPRGGQTERLEKARHAAFQRWLESPLEIRYDDTLSRTYKRYASALESLDAGRGRLATLLLGSREWQLEKATTQLGLEFGFHLYNLWKEGAEDNFRRLMEHLREEPTAGSDEAQLNVLDVIAQERVRPTFLQECENFICFDRVYDAIFSQLKSIASEAKRENVISRDSIEKLLGSAMGSALDDLVRSDSDADDERTRLQNQFRSWLRHFAKHPRRGVLLKSVGEWKRLAMPTVSESLFAIVTFLFEKLLPMYYDSEAGAGVYDGRVSPRNIGIKDFWRRLDYAYQDLLIEDILAQQKKVTPRDPAAILDRFFEDVEELDDRLMTRDPLSFPGFRVSIEQALDRGVTPCGTVAAIARLKSGHRRRVGVLVSNLSFQAGSFDMASGQKFCHLLLRCAEEQLPVICFISSGGMQTKEGAGSLFSMAIANDRLTRFVRDTELPVVCFGFGDCTGGAQASLVTHPLVSTYYMSGCNMPFAGQIVVRSHLPMTSRLSNYLSEVSGAMIGLVEHPFSQGLDEALRAADPRIPLPTLNVEEVLANELDSDRRVEYLSQRRAPESPSDAETASPRYRPVEKTLIHARGCTAVKLIRIAQRQGISVVLVQSDADMDSVAARMLGDDDTLVCIGGNTPDESYLNAGSVVRVAEREGADSLHPGIGFLSENSAFADLCRENDLNFIGPSSLSMQIMGNKSNAIQTALRLEVPVVPGSHGILTDVGAASVVAESIGYPVMLKAVHGGGGKGIRRVDSPDAFASAFRQIRAEAKSAFGNSDCYLERCVVSLRHIEVQVLRDRHGNCLVLGLRDCSVQRDNQKLIEESGSTLLSEELKQKSFDFARSIANEIDYVGAGTVEFIYDLDAQEIYFMEMNTRLQVEHPVTEATSGVDIVKAQYDIASGASIEALAPKDQGYAMEVRINAERLVVAGDGSLEIQPAPGTVTTCELPKRDDVEIIATVDSGSVISPYYDSLVAQLILRGSDRDDVIGKLDEYLGSVVVEGVATNVEMIRAILNDPVFRGGDYDTRFLTGFFERVDLDALLGRIESGIGAADSLIDRASIEIEGSDELRVMAPSGGVFYAAASPTDPAFAREGDRLDVESPLCLIEAMKLFRTISLSSLNRKTELFDPGFDYEVVRVNASDGQAVNLGDLLFVVRPVPKAVAGAAS